MKIALLTLPLHANYGGVLQAFALKTVLERLGHEVWLVDNRRREKTRQQPLPEDRTAPRGRVAFSTARRFSPN